MFAPADETHACEANAQYLNVPQTASVEQPGCTFFVALSVTLGSLDKPPYSTTYVERSLVVGRSFHVPPCEP